MHEALLQQAKTLAAIDPRRPSQVNLRRALSAAYYALFHCLTQAACEAMLGTRHEVQGFRHVLARAFTHTAMRDACRSFSGGNLPGHVLKTLPTSFIVPSEIRDISEAFLNAQEIRHSADYDAGAHFDRINVEARIEAIETSIAAFNRLPVASIERQFFLTCLLAWPTLGKR